MQEWNFNIPIPKPLKRIDVVCDRRVDSNTRNKYLEREYTVERF